MDSSCNTTDTGGEFRFIAHGINLQQEISRFICNTFKNQLPDLSQLVILVPAPDLIYTFRKILLAELSSTDQTAFIGAEISPVKKWIEQNTLLNPQQSFINNHCRQLIILQALQSYPAHFKDENLWQVSAALLQLFDELTANHLEILDLDENQWLKKIQQLYGIETEPEHLSSEARLIYTLWQAWQQQLSDDQLIDQSTAYVQRLQLAANEQQKVFVIAGAERLTANEIAFIKQLSNHHRVYFFIQANADDINNSSHPDHFIASISNTLGFINKTQANNNTGMLELAFNYQQELNQRIKQAQQLTIENRDAFKLYSAHSEEQEALAVDLQVRQWLLEGKRNIAIVTENRKLARRVRALLERAGVNLVDSVGWSLSTTSAASVVERWLECIEQDFAATCFLDFLKSPFISEYNTESNQLENVFRFEQDVVLHENISANLQRYIDSLQRRQHRLDHWESDCYQQIFDLLHQLDEISAPVNQLYQLNKKIPASQYLDTLLSSFQQLKLTSTLTEDEAGILILDELTHMKNACQVSDPEMNWFDFRTWLASALENHHYSPSSQASHVRLLNLKQSNSGYYDGLIIASVDASQLPGPAPKTPFFNNFVKQSLGLPDWQIQKQEHYYLFRRLVQSADNTLISYCKEKNNELQSASPWLQTIIDLYSGAGKQALLETSLDQLLISNKTTVLASTEITLPDTTQAQQPVVTKSDLPGQYSSSRHQRLINCPYQFFASDILKLRAAEELITELQKSEYGQMVHKILEIFHLRQPAAIDNFEQSLKQLHQISKQVFSQDIEDNFLHRGWLKRWLDHTESYLRWQQKRQQEWHFKEAELKQEISIEDEIKLEGRIDRIDQQQSALAIVDYKTSSKTPSQTDVMTGEDVQLSSYALLFDEVKRVEYLKLDEANGKVSAGACLTEDDISDVSQKTRDRFIDLIRQMEQSTSLIANGDDDSCRFCRISGLCRQQYWKLNA